MFRIALLLAGLYMVHSQGFAQNSLGVIKHNHIGLQVKDIEASTKFYTEVIGLERLEVPDNLKAIRSWFKIGPDQQIHLLAGRTEAMHNDKNGTHYALFVESIDKAEAFLKSKNLPYHSQVRFDGVKQLYVADPDGYLLELNEWKNPEKKK